MNKIIFSIALIIAACQVSAQTIDSIPHHNLGPHSARAQNLMQMSDNSLLGGLMLADEFPFVSLGCVFHKVSRAGGNLLEISDTLFIPYENLPWFLTAKEPNGDGNILVEFANDYENNNCYLRIRRFDDSLNLDTTEVIVPIADFLGTSAEPGLLLDPNGDIILSYYDYYSTERNFVRVGLDGTVKQQATINAMKIDSGDDTGPFVFSESPFRYCYWGRFYDINQMNVDINCYLLDSLFNITNCYTLPRTSGSPDYVNYNTDGSYTKLLGLDDGCFLVARPYNRPSSLYPHIEDDGVAVMKYDSDFNQTARRKFLSEPILEYSHPNARPIGFEKSKDGYIYFAYFTCSGFKYNGHYYGGVSVVKMDEDLNIIWQRHCLEPEGYGRDWGKMMVLEDNSVAVMGLNTIMNGAYVDHTEAFYIIVNDDYDGLEQQGIIIRPYTYYPNPVQNELHLQYSPDVKPTQIELYDLQGRLVCTQRNGLESINLEGLSAGTYTMRVTLENGKVFSDKIIKE